jgi:hypothetical protein
MTNSLFFAAKGKITGLPLESPVIKSTSGRLTSYSVHLVAGSI